jgi:hypothetical protein
LRFGIEVVGGLKLAAWSYPNHLEKMTGEVGLKGVSKLMGMAHWLEEQR